MDTNTVKDIATQGKGLIDAASALLTLILTVAGFIGGMFHGHKRATKQMAAAAAAKK